MVKKRKASVEKKLVAPTVIVRDCAESSRPNSLKLLEKIGKAVSMVWEL